MSKKYHLTLRVEEQQLTAVIGALAGSSTIVSIELINEPSTTKVRSFNYRNGVKLKGIKGEELVMKILTDSSRPVSVSDFKNKFRAAGFKEASYSGILSELVKAGKVRNLNNGMYSAK